ncbi:hypothetical protein DPMN_135332 [Dreissena polymorpha]|uniref:G-protein coupled receptors family 1 profile domain-containing protein n=1 Tax=Dreissena polymorpha TaxID=45954 RepID=A0A9D4FYZ2_DREPO|nr:hypothetical protein DPMN_135332 [Dreissena polymorpha]
MENLTAKDINDRLMNKIAWVSVIVGLEIVLGFIGNVVVIYVFGRRYHHCNFRYFVLCIALIDLLSVFTTMPAEIVSQLYWYVYPMGKSFCKIKSFLNIMTLTSETYCLCAVAVDRWRKMCRPHGWQIRPRHAFRICVVIGIVSAIQSSPVLILWGLYSYQIENITVTVCEKDEQYIDSNSHQIYISVNTIIIISSILAMNIVYVALYVKIPRLLLKPTHHLRTNASTADASTEKRGTDTYTVDITDTDDGGVDSISKALSIDNVNLNSQDPTTEDIELSTGPPYVLSNNASSTDKVTIPATATRSQNKHKKTIRIRKITRLTLTLCILFSITCFIYAGLLISIGSNKTKLHGMKDTSKAWFLFALRLVFINHVINPFVYWIMDREFRNVLNQAFYRIRNK